MRIRRLLAALLALGLLLGLCPAAVTEDIGGEIASAAVELAVPEEALSLGGGPEEEAGYADFVEDVAVAPAEGGIPVDAEHFTLSEYGSGFMIYVRDNIDKDGDGVLSEAERLAVTEIDFDYGSALDGLGYFPNLEKLTCNQVFDRLDVSGNLKLRELNVKESGFESIDLSKNTALESLTLMFNSLKRIDVSHNTELTYLNLNQRGNKPGLSSLDVSHNGKLTSLCVNWNKLERLDLSNNPALKELWYYRGGQAQTLDLSKNAALVEVHCEKNVLLKNLVLGNHPNLEDLECEECSLTQLDLSGCPALKRCTCFSNELTRLDITGCSALTTLECAGNSGLKELDICDCINTLKTFRHDEALLVIVARPTVEPTAKPTSKPTAAPKPTATVGEAAYMFTDKTGTYEVIGTKVTFVKPAKSQKAAKVPDTVATRGVKLKVVAIADKAFYKDKKLTSLTIGKYVKTIGAKAFYGCEKLKTLTLRTSKLTDKTVGAKAFGNLNARVVFKCPKAKLKAYKKLLKKKGAPKKAQYK